MCRFLLFLHVLQQTHESDSKHDSSYTSQVVESLTAKLNQSQEQIKEERLKMTQLSEKMLEYDMQLERIPLLIAQVPINY